MNIGIFSGSFNPIHMGHLILANYIAEYTDLDEIWFMLTPHNPLKDEEILLGESQRLEMLELALEMFSHMKACDFELSLPRPSYTVNTLDALREKYPEHNFTLIIGADNWKSFERWRDYEGILDKHQIMVYPRLGYRISIPNKLRDRVEALDSPIIEISSTFIRESIKEGKNMQTLLPEKVFRYIEQNKLYEK